MTRVASHRLIDAAATLAPAERALLNLLINRGLDIDSVARLAQTTPGAIAVRRDELIIRLSSTLGVPPATVGDALEELATSARAQTDAQLPSAVGSPSSAVGSPPSTVDSPSSAVGSSPSAGDSPASGNHGALAAEEAGVDGGAAQARRMAARRRRRRRLSSWLPLLIGALVVLVVVLIVALSPGRKTNRAAPAPRPAASTKHVSLAGLPGGPPGVAGSVTFRANAAHPRLTVKVSGLPASGRDHYELWLYNEILDAVPLASLSTPSASVTVALPRNYRRYRWVDISVQPSDTNTPSGESILRAAVPR